MTTPRDAIGLSERLRRGHNNSGLSPLDCKIGLDELDALSVRVKELEAGWHDCITELTAEKKRALVAEARALRAEQERDEAYERAVDAMRKAIDPSMEGILREAADRAETAIRRLAAGAEKEGE